MDVDVDQPKTKGKKEGKESGKPRFEVKKVCLPASQPAMGFWRVDYLYLCQWNAVSLWAWGKSSFCCGRMHGR